MSTWLAKRAKSVANVVRSSTDHVRKRVSISSAPAVARRCRTDGRAPQILRMVSVVVHGALFRRVAAPHTVPPLIGKTGHRCQL